MSSTKKKQPNSNGIQIGKKYFIKPDGTAYENNLGQVRRVLSVGILFDYTIENIDNDRVKDYQDCLSKDDLIPLKDFKYQVGDKVKVKKSYTSNGSRDGKELAGTEQTILKIDEFDSELPVLITAPEGYRGGFNEISNNYWVSYKDIKIVSRPH